MVQRTKAALFKARRRWGFAFIRWAVGLVVRVEMMTAQDPEEAANLLSDTFEATRKGIADFTGKTEYKFGDITRAAIQKFASKTMNSVKDFTGKDTYEFGDITKTAVSKFTGKEEYEFGDITKTAVKKFTGKDEYKFGDISRAAWRRLTEDRSEAEE